MIERGIYCIDDSIFILVYIILAVLFVKLIKKFTKRKLYKWLAVAFVILLPTWDVVLGIIAYPLACKFIPKTAIYETAETDGIYYEGEYKNTLWTATEHVAHADFDMMKGYKYMESLVTKRKVAQALIIKVLILLFIDVRLLRKIH